MIDVCQSNINYLYQIMFFFNGNMLEYGEKQMVKLESHILSGF